MEIRLRALPDWRYELHAPTGYSVVLCEESFTAYPGWALRRLFEM